MKLRWSQTTARAVTGVAASLILVMSFQNCGKAGFDADLDSTLSSSSSLSSAELVAKYGSTIAGRITDIPFAYDAYFDQITYNSCSENQLSGVEDFFSVKAGAYRSGTGGVQLRQTFIDYVNSNFYPVHPETTISTNQYKQYLADSPKNANAVPVMAIRVASSLKDIYSASSTANLNTDIIPMIGYLSDADVMDAYVNSSRPLATYFPFSSQFKVMEGTLRFNTSEGLARSYRSALSNVGALTLAFMQDSTTPYKPSSPQSSTTLTKAYGRGYSMSFSVPIGSTSTNMIANNVVSLREYNLEEGGSTVANWDCNHRYMIVRKADAATYCPSHTISELQDPGVRAELAIMRNQYPADKWDFNVSRRCAVPKGSVSCYKEETYNGAAVGASYSLTADCFQPYGTYTGSAPLARCPAFISVCVKP